MAPGVVLDGIARARQQPCVLRIPRHLLADLEERGRHVVLLEDREDGRRIGTGPVVEREGDHLGSRCRRPAGSLPGVEGSAAAGGGGHVYRSGQGDEYRRGDRSKDPLPPSRPHRGSFLALRGCGEGDSLACVYAPTHTTAPSRPGPRGEAAAGPCRGPRSCKKRRPVAGSSPEPGKKAERPPCNLRVSYRN